MNEIMKMILKLRVFLISLIFCVGMTSANGDPFYSTPTLVFRPGGQLLTDDGTNNYLSFILDLGSVDTNATRWRIQVSTNEGASWTIGANSHTLSTLFEVEKVPQTLVYWYEARMTDTTLTKTSLWSAPIKIWGEMHPRTLAVTVNSTNQVTLAFNEANISELGFLFEKATNAAFSGTVERFSSPPGTNTVQGSKMDLTVTNTGFAPEVTYYFRAYATNQNYTTEPSNVAFAAPQAHPGPAWFFGARNDLTGIRCTWQPSFGVVDRWYLDVSVGNTNSWANIYNTTNVSGSYTFTDNSRTGGSVCYYRVASSNQVGIVYSDVQMVIAQKSTSASVWYIDASSTGGNGTGTNWANAWPNFASIAWGSVNPGAVINIAAGTYHETVYCWGNDGISNSPITLKVSQETGHSGKVHIDSLDIRRKYTTWNGAASDTFVPTNVEAITNNINLVLGSTNTLKGAYVDLSTGQGCRLLWIECSKTQNPEWVATNLNISGEGVTSGIVVKGNPPQYDNEIGYVWVHDLQGDGIDADMFSPTNWGAITVHHCLVERVRGNFLSGNGGDYHDNILRDEWRPIPDSPPGVHPDGAQMWLPWLRMWNNVIRNTTGQGLYVTCSFTNNEGCYLYNNLIYSTGGTSWTNSDGSIGTKDLNSGIQFTTSHDNVAGIWDYMIITNVLIANNAFYGFDTAYLNVGRRDNQTVLLKLRNWTVVNNLFYDQQNTPQQDISTNDYQISDVVFDWNNCTGNNQGAGYGSGGGWQNFSTMSALGLSTGYTHNRSNLPKFMNVAYQAGQQRTYNFKLTSSDASLSPGTNLSSWEGVAPGISKTMTGADRNIWLVGPLEVGESLFPIRKREKGRSRITGNIRK